MSELWWDFRAWLSVRLFQLGLLAIPRGEVRTSVRNHLNAWKGTGL